MLANKLKKLVNSKLNADAAQKALEYKQEQEAKLQAEKEKRERRTALIKPRLTAIEHAIILAATAGKTEHREEDDMELSTYNDPLHDAFQKYAEENGLYYDIDIVPVYEEDCDRCTTNRVAYYKNIAKFSWKK